MASSLVEAKVLAKVKARLAATAAVTAIVPAARIYDSHLSTVSEPVYPVVSLHLLDAAPEGFSQDGAHVGLGIQVDLWVEADVQAKSVLYDLAHAVRAALHRYSVADGTVRILWMVERQGGAVLFESERRLWHLARRYDAVAA